ncbi:hypothetical protein SAMN04488032_103210 [Pacificibacter marinus]|uniref:Uncharacterized protein n=1 Tax=Pacificibacter marinus TaxID=658057 RepID=A0A1Y5SEH9_9RHOB|nr:hypothetical protein SAMN04488032_103210 [Pacificibacter marinus]SLN38904.1 hypothetical protein PAM7971_01762 [Pacificibacter marinus]
MIAQMCVAAQETLAAALKSERAPKNAKVVIKTGPIMDTIVAFAKSMGPDLVVLGTLKPRIFLICTRGQPWNVSCASWNIPCFWLVIPSRVRINQFCAALIYRHLVLLQGALR